MRFKTLPGDMNERKKRKRFTTRAPLYARIYQKQCRAQKTEEGFSRIQYAKRECVLRVDYVFLKKQKLKRFFDF
jgi:endonuclease/exonuclease/phosphatase family metal-dependent hydrolase